VHCCLQVVKKPEPSAADSSTLPPVVLPQGEPEGPTKAEQGTAETLNLLVAPAAIAAAQASDGAAPKPGSISPGTILGQLRQLSQLSAKWPNAQVGLNKALDLLQRSNPASAPAASNVAGGPPTQPAGAALALGGAPSAAAANAAVRALAESADRRQQQNGTAAAGGVGPAAAPPQPANSLKRKQPEPPSAPLGSVAAGPGPGSTGTAAGGDPADPNSPCRNQTGFIGVRMRKWGMYAAEIRDGDKRRWLGSFGTAAEAGFAYDAAAIVQKGTKAKTNFYYTEYETNPRPVSGACGANSTQRAAVGSHTEGGGAPARGTAARFQGQGGRAVRRTAQRQITASV
jgi:hypothetical protein